MVISKALVLRVEMYLFFLNKNNINWLYNIYIMYIDTLYIIILSKCVFQSNDINVGYML